MKQLTIPFLFSCLSAISVNAAEMRENNGSFFLECRFENRAETCHIDTGAYSARVRGYEPFDTYPSLGKTKSKGVSGEIIESDLIRVKAIRAGELKVSRQIVATVPTTFPHSVLGLEFFEKQSRVTFDFSRNQIRRERVKDFCPQAFVLKDKLIQIPVTTGNEQILAGWDTGASLNVVNRELVEKRSDEFEFIRDLLNGEDSSGAPVKAKLFRIKNLSVCGRTFTGLEVVAVDFNEPKKEMPDFPDLFIGANLMIDHTWSFDFKNRHWYFE